jgi:hypothetical protein
VVESFESIQKGELKPEDLPPIQVIVGPDEQDGKGPWYFSLNNRRLWVLKRCREEGFLEGNVIRVRVRAPKSHIEYERYSVENCALEATFKREKAPVMQITEEMQKLETSDDAPPKAEDSEEKDPSESNDNASETAEPNDDDKQESEDEESSSEDEAPSVPYRNPFDLGDSSDSDSD